MMTLLTTTRTAARLTQSMAIAIAACATALAAIARRGKTYHSLSTLDDRTLRDIGLNRSMLMSVAMGQKPSASSPVTGMPASHANP
jgi:uncharacterized protein YjiS (DUF1127 family)